jgi:hypothetical protein
MSREKRILVILLIVGYLLSVVAAALYAKGAKVTDGVVINFFRKSDETCSGSKETR